MELQDEIFTLLEPLVATLDVELVDVEWAGSTLRVVVDKPNGISSGEIVSVTRLISPVLDQHDPISSRYTLEVSSPGVERPLNRPKHFLRAVDEQVLIKLSPDSGHTIRRLKGRLVSVSGDELVVDPDEFDGVELDAAERVDAAGFALSVDDIIKARTVFDWGPKPKPGQRQKKRKKSGGKKKGSAKPEGSAGSAKKITRSGGADSSKHTTKEVKP